MSWAPASAQSSGFQRWAAGKLEGGNGAGPFEVNLDIAALERLAELCGLTTVDLIARLESLAEPLEQPN